MISTTFLVSTIAEILLSTDGMGIYLLRSQYYRIDQGVAACIVLAVAGWSINTFFLAIDRWLLSWCVIRGKSAIDSKRSRPPNPT